MLISENTKPSTEEFRSLMRDMDAYLNHDAAGRKDYYSKRDGLPLEDDVLDALTECSKGTPFDKTIIKVSGKRFPDIVAAKCYGVEVKSTKYDKWTSTGSSILESSRIPEVERIYMTFGKLGGDPVRFQSRPYEECLYDIAVTHMPRYRIDMRLREGETIFDKMGVPYDELRTMDNPVEPVSSYYRSQLKEGETLWWGGNSAEETVSATIKVFNRMPAQERNVILAEGMIFFPEVLAGKYDEFSMWLTRQGIACHNVRDYFSSSGQKLVTLSSGESVLMPAIYKRIELNAELCVMALANELKVDMEFPPSPGSALGQAVVEWIDNVTRMERKVDRELAIDALTNMFFKISE